MGIYEIVVGVCLVRPPTEQEFRKYLVAADSPLDAELVALQIAACTSEMPVSSTLVTAGPRPGRVRTRLSREGLTAALSGHNP